MMHLHPHQLHLFALEISIFPVDNCPPPRHLPAVCARFTVLPVAIIMQPPSATLSFVQTLPLLHRTLYRTLPILSSPLTRRLRPRPAPFCCAASIPEPSQSIPSAPSEVPSRGDVLLIVGLGNPGSRFERTRHNIGFQLVDAFANRHGASSFKTQSRHRALVTSVHLHDRTIHLAKPTTFMNASGDAVRSLMRYYNLPSSALLIVADDIALDVGRLRLRAKGSAGGHNGLKSIQKAVGGPDYARLKVGVGVAAQASLWADFVLAKLSRAEQKLFEEVEWDVVDILEYWIREPDINRVMNKLGMMQRKA